MGKLITIMACVAISSVLYAGEIVAHRGENTQAPENSIAAFKAAFSNGSRAIEGDFYLANSGEMYCIHGQSELKNLAGCDKPIVNLSPSDIESLDLARTKFKNLSPTRIPTVEEVFAILPNDKTIFFEIKNYPKGFFEKLESARKSAGLSEKNIVLISFDFNALKDAKKRNPNYKCLFLYGIKNKSGIISPSVADIADKVKSANLDGVDVLAHGLDKNYVADLKSHRLYVAVWTVNDTNFMKKLFDWGVDAVTTDKSSEFLKELSKIRK